MKRNTYVDNQGNVVDQSFESKKILLRFFFLIGTVIPVVLIGFIIYTSYENSKCNKIYNSIKDATREYLKDKKKLSNIEGESITISMDKLYNDQYLSAFNTNNMTCTGDVKATRYKKDVIYTLNLVNCNDCTTTKKYDSWSEEIDYLPNNPIVTVVPYYNYYQRQTVVTDWSKYYENNELQKKVSKYGVRLPKKSDRGDLPSLPVEATIAEVQKEEGNFYRYKDKQWKWYDIKGDYSDFSSEQPNGYGNKDEDAVAYTDWTKFSLNFPGEKEYREINRETGYLYYYEKDGKKIYANNKKYTASSDVDHSKYDQYEGEPVDMYSYRDTMWRWYNGQKRNYSSFSSEKPNEYNFKDEETMVEMEYSEWSNESSLNETNKVYRTEQKKYMTRFRYVYEILSDPVLKEPITKNLFVEKVGMSVPDFVKREDYKIDVTYKFKYMKR